MALHPDGRRAVSASGDNTLRVWDIETGTLLQTLAGHTNVVNAVALYPDGRRAVSASGDNTLRGWDLISGKELACLSGEPITALAITLTSWIVAGEIGGNVFCARLLEPGSGGK